MHSILISSFLLLSSALFVSADYGVSSPPAGEIFKIGDKLEVKWTVGNIVEPSVDVKLVHGPAENLQLFRKLCTLDPKVGTCTTAIDENIPSGIDYAIIIAGKDIGFSSYFTIQAKGLLPENKGCPKMGGKDCPENLPCCSASGFCGATEGHCGTGCQPGKSFNGVCITKGVDNLIKQKTSLKSSVVKCGKKICNSLAPCCSEKNVQPSNTAEKAAKSKRA
ncbi:16592_t:CDS:2 [Funneliformis geosporum]|uniref:5147_t:CDS:1 n=1 Tax=Funneliformis geosporum TaxID=1117311 RepID=A0A9W4WNW8_9GLOM|nr:5147_t:CDS:2 [Funneliformis geosporum]CAI2175965.1 16592_t:CDS:2 [Funneliformis geosporum]